MIEVGESCNEKDFDSLLQDLMIPKVNSVVQTESICMPQ